MALRGLRRRLTLQGIVDDHPQSMEAFMGRGILLWMIGVPIPIIILLALFWR
jgi:hypothetical protein